MSELMKVIYEYILERGMWVHIDAEEYRKSRSLSARLSDELRIILTAEQFILLDQYLTTQNKIESMEREAIFTTTLSFVRAFPA